jgi:hypothetical protein
LTHYVKIRDEEAVKNNAVYLALGGAPRRDHGYPRDMDRTERGAKFWLRVMTEIQNRAVSDILIAKLLYLALRNITKDWKMSARNGIGYESVCDSFSPIASCPNYINQLASHTEFRIRSTLDYMAATRTEQGLIAVRNRTACEGRTIGIHAPPDRSGFLSAVSSTAPYLLAIVNLC